MNEPGEKAAFKGQYPIRAVATVGMIGDAITRVGKGLVSVECLMAPGVDPHLYKASQKDVDRLDKADIVFYGGLHLEGKMTEILEKIGRIKPSIPVGEQLPAESLIRSEMKQGEITTDPHVWFDPPCGRSLLKRLARHWPDSIPAMPRHTRARPRHTGKKFWSCMNGPKRGLPKSPNPRGCW